MLGAPSPERRWCRRVAGLLLLAAVGCQAPLSDPDPGSVEHGRPPPLTPACSTDRAYLEAAASDVARRDRKEHVGSLAPYWPSPDEVVECMLDLAGVGVDDVVIDLGSGDGRVVIAAARRGARGIGIDYDPVRIAEANANAEIAAVQDLVTFIEQDVRDADLSNVTVVTLYLGPEANLELLPKLTRELRQGARIVSHDFGMGQWIPDRTVRLRPHTIYLWRHDGVIRPTRVEARRQERS